MQYIFSCLDDGICSIHKPDMGLWIVSLILMSIGIRLFFKFKHRIWIYILLFIALFVAIRISFIIENLFYKGNQFDWFIAILILITAFLLFLLFAKIEERLKEI